MARKCKDCSREYARVYIRHRNKIPKEHRKNLARRRAYSAFQNGTIKKLPCAACGNRKSQIHHPDYRKPLFVVWLCSRCHGKLYPRKRKILRTCGDCGSRYKRHEWAKFNRCDKCLHEYFEKYRKGLIDTTIKKYGGKIKWTKCPKCQKLSHLR
jgi:hypothetical protein